MDEKLIVSVFKYPVLYDATLVEYRCMDSRIIAWKNVSTLVGQPVDDCKRKWKNLRDHFIKELRKEVRSKSQGELVSSRWKYRQQLNYLAPFCTPRRRVPDLDQDRDRQRAPAGAEAETKPSDKADVLPVAKIPDVRSQASPRWRLCTSSSPREPGCRRVLRASGMEDTIGLRLRQNGRRKKRAPRWTRTGRGTKTNSSCSALSRPSRDWRLRSDTRPN
ncbi:uncharacterized protein LOC133490159 isoform X2 [Phyllopteryx taeniolatus]|uniref:uncharacterized protein LOC133490159 isoform X2 n=1 Tax=Phyllopteryx taeniolatus TaxID=161469 RepID=UPI002AD2AA13|nr:uncharacterized protein LOC133490159 isoform X2 [Phyllopteryx taeniolatus]